MRLLVLCPAVAHLAQCLGAAAQECLRVPFLEHSGLAGFSTLCLCEQAGWAGEDIVDPLNQGLGPLGVAFPDVLPGSVVARPLFCLVAPPPLKRSPPPAPASTSPPSCHSVLSSQSLASESGPAMRHTPKKELVLSLCLLVCFCIFQE